MPANTANSSKSTAKTALSKTGQSNTADKEPSKGTTKSPEKPVSETREAIGAADAIGVNRGEVTRLGIFLACLAQIPAAYVCRHLGRALAFGLVVFVTLLQNAVGTAMIGFVVP